MQFRKDHWYWIRLKFGTTAMMARPHEINSEGEVTYWSMPWYIYQTPCKAAEYVVISEVPFPEGYNGSR